MRDCSAPSMSSHLRELLSAPLGRASVAERLVWARGVVPVDPGRDLAPGVRKVREEMLPDTFLLEASEEPFDDAVLLGRVRRDELLAQPIVATGRPEAPTLVDQPVV